MDSSIPTSPGASKEASSAQYSLASGFDVIGALFKAFDRRRLGHALLFVNRKSHREFTESLWRFCKGLLCTHRLGQGSLDPCGHCESCLLLAQNPLENPDSPARGHPDLVLLRPEAQTGYSVDQMRALNASFSLRHSLSDCRVALIEDAETLGGGGGAAANSLLKLLEEPRPQSFLILSTSKPDSLLPTLVSRCQRFVLRSSSSQEKSNPPLLEEKLQDPAWKSFQKWINSGAPRGQFPASLPADSDAFWKDRGAALEKLEFLFQVSWEGFEKNLWGRLQTDAALQLLSTFEALQTLIRSISHFGQPNLQWSRFRAHVNLGIHSHENY